MEHRRFFWCACVCLLAIAATYASGQEAVKDQAICYTTWDDNYLYIACRVDCPDVRGTHSTPNSDVTGDDAVSVFVESDNKRASKPTPNCFSMTVSAASGSQFRIGSDNGTLDPKPVWTFKYGSTVQGTLNNGDDVDMGYTVEIALPWELMNMKRPRLGDMISFNLLIHRHGTSDTKPISLSPRVVTQDDVLNPSKWMNLLLVGYSFGAMMPNGDKILSAKSIVRPPLIDGVIKDREWPKNNMFALDLPTDSGFVYEAKYPIRKIVFAKYFYSYQMDPRREATYTQLVAENGSIGLQHFPVGNIGPWFSSDRVQWHKNELSDMAVCGIDVVLPVYRGDKTSRSAYASKGLDCMVMALAELKAEGKPYPLVGMFFDLESMDVAYGGEKPNFEEEEVKRTFYGMIKDFFDRIPAEFRAWAQTGKPIAGRLADIVFLGFSEIFSDIPYEFLDYAKNRYQQDFGRSLVWIVSKGKTSAQEIDGVCVPAADFRNDDHIGRIRVISVRPGLDNSAVSDPGTAVIRSRMDGKTYDDEWSVALNSNPHWILCDSWNNFAEGSEICASSEYGRKYIDATNAQVSKFKKGGDFGVEYLRWNIPVVIKSKQITTAELILRNTGMLPWRISDGFAIGYRWYKNGRFYSESKVRRPLGRDVAPGETIELAFGIATVDAQGQALTDGNYELRIELIRQSDERWLSTLGVQPLLVPITVGDVPEWSANYITCDVPVMLESAKDYRVRLRVRNEGSNVWSKGKVKLGCKLYKVSNYTNDNPNAVWEEVPIRNIRVLLAKDCKPGEIAEFDFLLNLSQSDNKPLPAWKPEYAWSYLLRFDLYNGASWFSELGSRTLDRIVDIFDADYGPRIVDSDLPITLSAGQLLEAKVVLRNRGVRLWDRKKSSIGYHWYHLDGLEMLWNGITTPFTANIQPGWPVIVSAKVKAPEYDGRYVLVWDTFIDGKWVSTLPLVRGGDILPVLVEVKGGRLVFVDLSDLFDVVAASPDTDRASGNFDTKGSSFPAEYMPPDANSTLPIQIDSSESKTAIANSRLYPSGYKLLNEAVTDGRISFLYPDKTVGSKSAVACNGQNVAFEQNKYTALHILGASSEGDTEGTLLLNYSNGSETVKLQMSDWGSGPKHGENIGLMIRHRHTPNGDDASRYCYLYHIIIPLDKSRTLTSINLPQNKAMKVMAITLERAELPIQEAVLDGKKP